MTYSFHGFLFIIDYFFHRSKHAEVGQQFVLLGGGWESPGVHTALGLVLPAFVPLQLDLMSLPIDVVFIKIRYKQILLVNKKVIR